MSHSPDASSPSGSGSKKPHAPLTAEQKKQNHILSEQKRRGAIRLSFDRLTTIVPGTEGRGRSEMIVLSETTKHIREQLLRHKALIDQAEAKGFVLSEKDRAPLKQLEKFVNPTEGDWTLKADLVDSDGDSSTANGKKREREGTVGESETSDGAMS